MNEKKVLENKKTLDDLGAWMGKHDLSILEVMEVFSSFMAYSAVNSGDPAEFIKKLTGMLLQELGKHKVDK